MIFFDFQSLQVVDTLRSLSANQVILLLFLLPWLRLLKKKVAELVLNMLGKILIFFDIQLQTALSGQVGYTLEVSDSSEGQFFAINGQTGKMIAKKSFDREDRNHDPKYNVFAVATDKGVPPLAAKVTISVAIVDQNDQPPIFPKPSYEVSVQEDAGIGTSVGEFTATDADIGDNARLDYFISSGDASHIFKMESVYGDQNFGILILAGKLDFETKKTYNISITATDRKDSATVPVVVNVSNYMQINKGKSRSE